MATLDTVATRSANADSIPDGKAYFETSTNQFIVWDATDFEWIQLDSDGTGSYAFNIDIRDTESNILDMTPDGADADNAVVAYATDTHDFYIYDGSTWCIYRNDSSDPIFDGQLTFPDIQVFDNESDFINNTGADDYTIVHAKDTDKLYVWDGSAWVIFNNN